MAWCAAVLASTRLPAQTARDAWMVRRDAAADLWFHGLALAGAHGFGSLPLTDPAYAARAVAAKAGTPASGLDRSLDRFRAAFAADSAFEVLQFVPVWAAMVDHRTVAEAMRAVAGQGAAAVAGVPPRARLAAAAVAGTLTSPAQRRLLGEFVDALESEWAVFLATWRAGEPADADVAAADARWRALTDALAPYLRAERLAGGLLLVSPALGADGRLFEGAADDHADAVIAVQLPPGGADAAYLALREVCFPAVRRLPWAGADRVADERLRGTAAVRCGALLLDRFAPGHAAAYRSFWVRVAGGSDFEQAFAVPAPLRAALERDLATP
jgi:hypothetical protein